MDRRRRVIRFPKRTVWLTDRLAIPMGASRDRPDDDTWILALPGRPTAQFAGQEYGLEKAYVFQEFEFEGGYHIFIGLNPSNPPDKAIEVFFYHQGRQVQPVIDFDTKTVSFPAARAPYA